MTASRPVSATAALVRRLPYALPLVIFAALAVYFWAGLGRDPNLLPSVLIDRPVPAFALPPIEGAPHGLSSEDLKGQVTLVNIFGSWCVACLVEHPYLMQLSRDGVVPIYGIDWREKDRFAGPAWLAQHGNPYARVGDDPDSHAAIALGVTGAPETFIVDHLGVVRYKQVGPITPEIWKNQLAPIVRHLQEQAR
jgi:cytochrome c biogenesis protein CcmG/thiol:disulfide interchange protein DsbE